MSLVSISPEHVEEQVFPHTENYFHMLSEGHWSLAHAHDVLRGDNLSLFQIAGLAKAIACFQCSAE